jgi:predicted anti-sigma-YlaC factor YlaD
MSWMQPACEEAARLMSQQRDEPLGRWQRLRLRWHLARCGDCREVERQLARIGSAAAQWLAVDQASAPPDAAQPPGTNR